jgi:uncharacterized metal-binding protein
MSAEIIKVGIIACSGEAIAEGTISRLATRRVLETLRPDRTVTLCLPLFIAGNEGERNFAKTHPTIAIDGCPKQCARWGTEQHSGPLSGALVVSEILGTAAAGCSRSSRGASKADKEAVWTIAEHIVAKVDRILDEMKTGPSMEKKAGAECACSAPVPGRNTVVAGTAVTIPGLQLIFQQSLDRRIPEDDSGSTALLEAVKIYHRILPEEEEEYRSVLMAAYREFRRERQAENAKEAK